MPVSAFILMTQEQKEAAELLDDVEAALGPRYIENPMANNLGLGTLVGQWISPARLLNDPDYQRWVPTLGLLPIHIFDTDTLFIPIMEDEG